MALESLRHWEQCTKAKEAMVEHTHMPEVPWWVVEAADKKRARLNCIHHLLGQIPYAGVKHPDIALPVRVHNPNYFRAPIPKAMFVPAICRSVGRERHGTPFRHDTRRGSAGGGRLRKNRL